MTNRAFDIRMRCCQAVALFNYWVDLLSRMVDFVFMKSMCNVITHKPKQHFSRKSFRGGLSRKNGFALIATLLLMILLALLTVGTLSLSVVTLRSSERGSAMAEARANARMALMVAIGELQKHTGPDTRITAPANIVEDDAPALTGVWKSWEGTNHDATGRPIQPDYEVKTKAQTESTQQSNNGRFLTWLVSGARPNQGPQASGNRPTDLVSETSSSSTIPLLSEGTLGDDPGRDPADSPREVHVVPMDSADGGKFAWWVSPENQKAKLSQPHKPRTEDESGWSEMAKSHAVPDPGVFGLESLVTDKTGYEEFNPDSQDTKAASKAISLATTELIATDTDTNAEPQHHFHDLSTTAVGLLTNTATGGWRKDLSILTEKWSTPGNNIPASGLPLFRIFPDITVGVTRATSEVVRPTNSNPTTSQSIFYPWSAYGIASGSVNNPSSTYFAEQNGAASSWHSLVEFVTAYKNIDFDSGTGIGSVPLSWARTHRDTPWGPTDGAYSNTDLFNYLHKIQIGPVLARVQWIFKLRSRRKNYNPQHPEYNRYDVDLLVSPVYTLWNPFNVKVDITDRIGVAMNKTFPMAIGLGKSGSVDFRRYINGSRFWTYREGEYDSSLEGNYSNHWEQTNGQAARFPPNISLAPGEVKTFSLSEDAYAANGGVIGELKAGYDGTDNKGYISVSGNNPRKPRPILSNYAVTDEIEIDMKFDNVTQLGPDPNQKGPGIMMTLSRAHEPGVSNNNYLGDNYQKYSMLTSKDFSTVYWQRPADFPDPTISSIFVEPSDNTGSYDSFNSGGAPWTPVFSVVFGPRMSIGSGAGNPNDRPTKGVLVNNPFTTSALTTSDAEWTNHPVNIPFDFSVHAHVGGTSETIPDDSDSIGYLFTGYQGGTGLSRLIFAELPLRPMVSLTELQNWNLQGNKPVPPYQYNIIGNSDASPLIEADSILPTDPIEPDVALNLQHDDAYCANHLLFDDWFFSTIAPEPSDFGKVISEDITTVYREYLKGERLLSNRAYRPITEDKSISDTLATTRISEVITSPDGWQKVASRFEVSGMFNVNSTSVKAWRALLGHARQQQVAHQTAAGIVLDTNQYDHVLTRHSVASDVAAGDSKGLGADFPFGSEYAGFRTFDDGQLNQLAQEIVEQVSARGPFLSLSEFVNRQLITAGDTGSNGETISADDAKELALAGALQAALDSLTNNLDPMKNLKDSSKQLSSVAMDPDDDKLDGMTYAFPDAAEGMNTYGFPGWIRQADVLRPLAPILSARDDTFTIRAYGDSRDSSGRIIAKAWCEAAVVRTRDFVDPVDAADSIDVPTSQSNQDFGRRYKITSFRWLSENEV